MRALRASPGRLVPCIVAVLVLSACDAWSSSPPANATPAPSSPGATAGGLVPSSSLAGTLAPDPSDAPASGSPSPPASVPPSPAPSAHPTKPPATTVRHDPRKFGFAAKGMSHEVMAFVTSAQIGYALDRLDLSVVSSVAYFSLEAGADGSIRHNGGWRVWTSPAVTALIEKAHRVGTKVVISLKRFSWSAAQTEISGAVLATAATRQRLADEVTGEVVRRGVDGVNVDFEPIPRARRAEFTDFVRRLRRRLDEADRGRYQLTFDIVGHYDSWDVGAALKPGGADAVYLMGYQYAGSWTPRAGSTAPMGGTRYDVMDTIAKLRVVAKPEQLIVGVPFYGHAWPTVDATLHARTTGGGFDVPYEDARDLARAHGLRYDRVEQVAWVTWRASSGWMQLYFDDARAAAYKWSQVKRLGLLGSGMWTAAFEGGPAELTAELRTAFLAR
jgi:spore germination protein YaaH